MSDGQDMGQPGPAQPADRRDRRVYVWWGAGLGFLLALGLFCWLVLGPFLEARSAIMSLSPGAAVHGLSLPRSTAGYDPWRERRELVARLGGPDDAVWPLSVYARAPRRLAPFRWAAAYLLWDCSDRAVPVLARLLRDSDAEVRVMAARALSGRTDPRALGPLVLCLGDDSPGVRWWAAKGLGRIGSPRAAAALEAALADGDERVRAAAAEALKRIRREEPPK